MLKITPSVWPFSLPAVLSFMILSGCMRQPAPLRLQWTTMGTIAAVQCADHGSAHQTRALSQAAFEALNKDLSNWSSDSALAAVNRAAGTGQLIPISPTFTAVLKASLEICEESDGAFNPLIGPVMRVWGFNGATPRTSLPQQAELQAAAALTDWRMIERVDQTKATAIRLPSAGMQLDFGAIAKGYAVDLAWERLKASGHNNLLIDLGGNLRAIGEAAPGRGGWRTGIRNPFDNSLIALFLMRDGEAVATSGNYERFVEIDGVRYAHIIDPRTGIPVTGMAGTTVVAPDAMTADALSTTLFILGPQKGAGLLRRHPGCEALWIPDLPDTLTLLATPGMAQRLAPLASRLSPCPYTLTVISSSP
jgi:thiamine biosynthesis lipoprotein